MDKKIKDGKRKHIFELCDKLEIDTNDRHVYQEKVCGKSSMTDFIEEDYDKFITWLESRLESRNNEPLVEEVEAVDVQLPAVMQREESAILQWDSMVDSALVAKQARNKMLKEILVESYTNDKGDKISGDYGNIPGCGNKPVLFKSGAEKIIDAFGLYADYELLSSVRDWDKPLFHFEYKCLLRHRATGQIVSTGVGECNSMESRYRWRQGGRVCPECGVEAIKVSKFEPVGSFYCFSKAGGCGAKFAKDDESITSQDIGKVPNDDIYTQVNTINKMAQKRSLVQASLGFGFSEVFTQDIEDNPDSFGYNPKVKSEIKPNDKPQNKPPKTQPKPSPKPTKTYEEWIKDINESETEDQLKSNYFKAKKEYPDKEEDIVIACAKRKEKIIKANTKPSTEIAMWVDKFNALEDTDRDVFDKLKAEFTAKKFTKEEKQPVLDAIAVADSRILPI